MPERVVLPIHGNDHCRGGPDPIPCLTTRKEIWGWALYDGDAFTIPQGTAFGDWTSIFGADSWTESWLSQDAIDTGVLYPEPDASVLTMIIDGTADADASIHAAGAWYIEMRAAIDPVGADPSAGSWIGLQNHFQPSTPAFGTTNDGSVTVWQPADLIAGSGAGQFTIDHRFSCGTIWLVGDVADTQTATLNLFNKTGVDLNVIFAEILVAKINNWVGGDFQIAA